MRVRILQHLPKGLIQKEELPEGWGLLWTRGKKVTRIVGPRGNYFPHDGDVVPHYERSKDSEISMLVSALRRK